MENRAPLWGSDAGWRFSEHPELTIGMVDGPEEYHFHNVGGSARLRDGRIVVADGGTHQIRFYDSEGRFLRSVGREGDGPGEFRQIARMVRDGDSIYVADWENGRVSIFDDRGVFARTVSLVISPGGRAAQLIGRFTDGSWAVNQVAADDGSGADDQGILREAFVTLRWDEAVSRADTVARAHGPELYRFDSPVGILFLTPVPFGRVTTTVVQSDRVVIGTAEAYELSVYQEDGRLERLIRRDYPLQPVTAADIRARDAEHERTRAERASGPFSDLPRPSELPRPATKPAFAWFVADTEQNLWVADYDPNRRPDQASLWSVFDPNGHWLGDVTMPAGLYPQEIGADYVIGIARDELRVQFIRMYRLIKP